MSLHQLNIQTSVGICAKIKQGLLLLLKGVRLPGITQSSDIRKQRIVNSMRWDTNEVSPVVAQLTDLSFQTVGQSRETQMEPGSVPYLRRCL